MKPYRRRLSKTRVEVLVFMHMVVCPEQIHCVRTLEKLYDITFTNSLQKVVFRAEVVA